MTTKQKARAYDNALERAKEYNFDGAKQVVKDLVTYIFPELKEGEDEKIRKELIEHIKANECADYVLFKKFSPEDVIAWLEKQEKQKSADSVEPKFEIEKGKWYVCNTSRYTDFVVGKAYYCPKNGMLRPNENEMARYVARDCFHPWSISDAKDGDKAEPKFHEGDWVTDGVCTTQIDSVDDRFYWHDNNRIGGLIDKMNKAYHLWTIKDAKDGDILVNGSNIFIFSHLSDTRTMGYCHINLDDERFYDDKDKTECFGLIDAVFSPATKEQRDLLFQKMKEARYTFDFDKKELRKIEQNLANSAKPCENDTLLDLLHKMPSCITVDGIDYHFVMKKTIAFMAFYEGEGEGSGKVIFWMVGDPIALLTAMLNKLKEEGLLESF